MYQLTILYRLILRKLIFVSGMLQILKTFLEGIGSADKKKVHIPNKSLHHFVTNTAELSVWLAQLFKALATPTHVCSCVQVVQV